MFDPDALRAIDWLRERLELESKLRYTLAKVDTKNAELDALRKDQELTVAKALIEYVGKRRH